MVRNFSTIECSMASSCSQPISEDEEYEIPRGEEYRHRRCAVRSSNQLTIMEVPQNYYCRIVKNLRNVTTRYRCETCHLNFCFNKKRNHFKKWHSPQRGKLKSGPLACNSSPKRQQKRKQWSEVQMLCAILTVSANQAAR